MKVFVATGIFHPESGGPATYLREILPEFQRLGWDIRVLTYGYGPVEGYGYPLTRIPRKALPLRLLGYGLAARPLLVWADVVYVHTLGLPLWGAGRAPRVAKIVGDLAWERAVRKGWVPATTDIDVFQTEQFDHVMAALGKQARSREARKLDAIIVPSAYLKQMVVGWGVDSARVHVVYNALPRTRDSAASLSQADARRAVALPVDIPILLTAARLTPWKGVQHLIAALRQVRDVRLLVAGDGAMLAELQARAEAYQVAERVVFLGSVSREKMPLYMRAADYVALYSGYEGLSHTLLESLREGTPVIASDKGGNPEVVQPGVNGLLVPYVDVEALAAAIKQALEPGMRAALAANTEIGLERFVFDRMIAETAQVLERAAHG